MFVSRSFFKNHQVRYAQITALFISIYSEFITRVDKKIEKGNSFKQIIEMIDSTPSETIKYELLKLLRSHLQVNGSAIFMNLLDILLNYKKCIFDKYETYYQIEQSNEPLYHLTSFFTNLFSGCVSSEIKSHYELIRNVLWFANWLVYNKFDTARLEDNDEVYDIEQEIGRLNIQDNRELRFHEDMLRSVFCLKFCTNSVLGVQESLNEHLRHVTFSD